MGYAHIVGGRDFTRDPGGMSTAGIVVCTGYLSLDRTLVALYAIISIRTQAAIYVRWSIFHVSGHG